MALRRYAKVFFFLLESLDIFTAVVEKGSHGLFLPDYCGIRIDFGALLYPSPIFLITVTAIGRFFCYRTVHPCTCGQQW